MTDKNQTKPTFTYEHRSTLTGWPALILLAPLLLVFFSVVLTILAGGALAALFLPLFFRGRLGVRRFARREPGDQQTIDLDPSQYTHVESPPPRLPASEE